MPRITVDLLRKRAEHNEGMISTLEEISLHQEELERIEVIGTLCRKIKILYLQNNIIPKLEDLTHMKDLNYLNVALNNITKIEGLEACEFLNKLDLTVNFIDFDTLEESINHLKPLRNLKDLYLLGNPAQVNWDDFNSYIIASLPQIELLDGKEITRTDRIKAMQLLPSLKIKLRQLAQTCRDEKRAKAEKLKADYADDVIEIIPGEATDISNDVTVQDVEDEEKSEYRKSQIDQETTPYTAESRREMYLELAEQKEEAEARKRENQPRERNYEAEHQEALEKAREAREAGEIRQCNEGKWDFYMDEEEDPGFIVIEISLSKFLDSSLIDVDAHPNHVSVVIKNKTLRLKFSEEVNSDSGTAERSKVTGNLKLKFPKSDLASVERSKRLYAARKLDKEQQETELEKKKKAAEASREKKVGEMVLEVATNNNAVNYKKIVKQDNQDDNDSSCSLKAVKTRSGDGEFVAVANPEDEEPPPLF